MNFDADCADSVWRDEHVVSNDALAPRVALKIGGDRSYGAVEHIERFAFYGGGGVADALAAAARDGRAAQRRASADRGGIR